MLTQDQIIKLGQDTIAIEVKALVAAEAKISQNFVDACLLIKKCGGKVVVTGLGKSGHIARKIAATLASTGTSAFFLHPSEALHGDMGMLQARDILLALAYSGETSEVIEVCKFAKRQQIPIIALTGKPDSSLGQLSTVVLDASVAQEACPLGLAPTASSTLALALGDALAVALMGINGITPNEFATWHPAGSLGRRLSLVKDVMLDVSSMQLITENEDFFKVITAVTEKNSGVAPVVNSQGELIGCVTDGDLRRALLKYQSGALEKSASSLMTQNPATVFDSELTLSALNIMEAKKITSIFVLGKKDKKLLGIIKMHDILRSKLV
ncbi:MAG: KpsF/GutQ family sugar-phosphate isomerase [Oligoflexales bacterium]|nr:KpsF/GutQ family sugar-phosphate isomerase [Oligoflexales bacterium]